MIITFNELRRIKDRLPSGSSQRIADELGISVDSDRKSTRLNSSHIEESRMPSSA